MNVAEGWSLCGGGSAADIVTRPVVRQFILYTTAEHQQASILASIEREGHTRARTPSKAVWLVVIAGAIAVE
jgi:hypothetical protein